MDRRVYDSMATFHTEVFGNASSIHSFGREAKAALEESREKIATLIGSRPSELFFTSGGTESDNAALFGIASVAPGHGRRHIVISSIEHHAVLHAAEHLKNSGFSVTLVGVDESGFLAPSRLERAVTENTLLVSVIHANNEIGTLQDLKALADVAHEKGALFHTDAVQSFGKVPLDVAGLGADLSSFTAHKLYGPKGIGALYIRRGIDFEPVFHGGAQERNRRPGTESVPLAVGFATAAEIAVEELDRESKRLAELNAVMRKRIAAEIPSALFNSPIEGAIPNILSLSIDSSQMQIDGDALIVNLDLEGIAVTSGSACSSGSLQPSHVIKSLGRDDMTTAATIRFSLGRFTTEAEIHRAVDVLANVVGRIGKRKRTISAV